MSDTNWAFTFSATESGVRRWDLRGPAGVVRFQTIDVAAGRYSSVFLHVTNPPAGTDPDDIEPCEVCGKGWHDALDNSLARELRAEWEAAGDDEIIREALERWYNEELSTPPVPVSEGSQVSGEEVGPATNGPNLAATGAGAAAVPPVPVVAQPKISDETDCPHLADILAGRAKGCHDDSTCGWCAVMRSSTAPVPVPVVAQPADQQIATIKSHFTRRVDTLKARAERAERERDEAVATQPRYVLDAPAILDMVGRYAEACVEAATTGSPKGREDAREQIRDLWDAIRAALTPVPDVEPEPRWGSGPLVDHNPETTGTGSAYPAKYGYCAQCGAEPGQSCHYMFGDGTANQEPNSVRPEPHFYRDSPDDDPNWRNLRAYKGSGTGSADRTKVEHRVVETETLNYLTGSERLTCSCGWSGHSTRWNDRDHGADVPRPPASAPRPPVSRDALRAALYGDRRGGAR